MHEKFSKESMLWFVRFAKFYGINTPPTTDSVTTLVQFAWNFSSFGMESPKLQDTLHSSRNKVVAYQNGPFQAPNMTSHPIQEGDVCMAQAL